MNWLAKWLGSCFGIGFSPIAPGTFGSLFAILTFVFVFSSFSIISFSIIIFFALLLGIWLGFIAEKKSSSDDPQWFVLDEWVGQSIPLLLVKPDDYVLLGISFILFRFFDISKILGINPIQKLKGGLGIMMDDVVAGIYSLIILLGIEWIIF